MNLSATGIRYVYKLVNVNHCEASMSEYIVGCNCVISYIVQWSCDRPRLVF